MKSSSLMLQADRVSANRHYQLLLPLVGKTEAPSDSRSQSGTYKLPRSARRDSLSEGVTCVLPQPCAANSCNRAPGFIKLHLKVPE